MNAPRHRLLVGLALGAALASSGCSGTPTSLQPALPATSRDVVPAARHAKQILYVLVNVGTYGSYVALYDAYGKNAQPIGKITQGLYNPGAIWVDAKGNVYVGNDMTYTSSVVEYAPGSTKPKRTYRNGIDLPFGGTVDSGGTMYLLGRGHQTLHRGRRRGLSTAEDETVNISDGERLRAARSCDRRQR